MLSSPVKLNAMSVIENAVALEKVRSKIERTMRLGSDPALESFTKTLPLPWPTRSSPLCVRELFWFATNLPKSLAVPLNSPREDDEVFGLDRNSGHGSGYLRSQAILA